MKKYFLIFFIINNLLNFRAGITKLHIFVIKYACDHIKIINKNI